MFWYNELSDSEEFPFSENLSDEDYQKSFYYAIKPAMKVGKIFGFFPININSKQPHEIIFKWRCYRTAYSVLFMTCSAFFAFGNLKSQTDKGELTPVNLVGVIFFSVCFSISFMFFKISRQFRKLMIIWSKVERIFFCEKYDLPENRWSMRKQMTVFLWTFLAGALMEHLFYLAAEVYKLNFEFAHCNMTDADAVEIFITKHLNFVILSIPIRYNHVLGVAVEFVNVSLTLWWNYLDLFIILVSIGLAHLYEKISYRMECLKTIPISETVWEELRTHHVAVSELVTAVNNIFGVALIVACCNDGYFILIQMLNITISLPFAISVVYFWFSLVYLITRATVMIMFASRVNEYAREPMNVIRSIPTEYWCTELQRFFEQMKIESNSNSLSGKNFFFINKRLLFSIAGALVTYELVLIQFDGKKLNWQDVIDCNSST